MTVECEPGDDWRARVASLRALCVAVMPLLADLDSRVRFAFSDVVLDAMQFGEMLDGWTDTAVPVHAFIAFDFAARPPLGIVRGARSHGLAALVGQEVACWPARDSERLSAARMSVRVAHDMLLNGPVTRHTEVRGWDGGPKTVALVPEPGNPPVVRIAI